MTRYEPMGTSSAVASVLHSGGKRHNKIEVTKEISFEHPPIANGDILISREQAIETAKRLVEKYEKLDDNVKIDVIDAAKDMLPPEKIHLSPEMDEDDPAYSMAPADFTTGKSLCLGGCGFKAALDTRFRGYCCGKCWYHTNDPEAGKKRKHCRRCMREWYSTEENVEESQEQAGQQESSSSDTDPDMPGLCHDVATDYDDTPSLANTCMYCSNRISENETICAECNLVPLPGYRNRELGHDLWHARLIVPDPTFVGVPPSMRLMISSNADTSSSTASGVSSLTETSDSETASVSVDVFKGGAVPPPPLPVHHGYYGRRRRRTDEIGRVLYRSGRRRR